jgi:hypothetical protein
MNNFFSFKRFLMFFMKQTAEHYRVYLMATAVLAGVMLLGGSFIFFALPDPPDIGMQIVLFFQLMLISGTIFTSTVFNDYGNNDKAIASLTLPVTPFEKFLVGWLYSLPIFLLIYTSIFFLILSGLASATHWPLGTHYQQLSFNLYEKLMVLTAFSLLHAIAIFGSILFRNLQFIKMAFVFFIFYAVILILNTVFLKALTGIEIMKPAAPFANLNFVKGHRFYSLAAAGGPAGIKWATMALMAILIWIAAYFRVKEKQV